MKNLTLLFFLFITIWCKSQLIKKQWLHEKLVISSAFVPLENGKGGSLAIQHNFLNMFGTKISFGYGASSPEVKGLQNFKDKGHFFALSGLLKTREYVKDKRRRFILNTGLLFIHGKGEQSANLIFKGNDFDDFVTPRYSQKYAYNYFVIPFGAFYRINKKLSVEIDIFWIGIGNSANLGNQYFKHNVANMQYHCLTLGIGYQIWQIDPAK